MNRSKSYYYDFKDAVWTNRNYNALTNEGYIKNVIAYRSINMIVNGAASLPMTMKDQHGYNIPMMEFLKEPNPTSNIIQFLERIYKYRLISGNAYVLSTADLGESIQELYVLRPDMVDIIHDGKFLPKGYKYKSNDKEHIYRVNQINGASQVLHLKNFHPFSEIYGLSPIEAAAYSIDQHNSASAWNQSLLQNGARPSGAIVVKGIDGGYASLSAEQYSQIKNMVDESFSGPKNAGRPIILEGGIEWKEISLSPKDMDFIKAKDSAARDIALAFGVPPQMLGIPGDNTYNTYAQARIALWEQTIIPYAENTINSLSNWLSKITNKKIRIEIDKDKIPALMEKREINWERVQNSDFMTINEKRKEFGLKPIDGGDKLKESSL